MQVQNDEDQEQGRRKQVEKKIGGLEHLDTQIFNPAYKSEINFP